MLSHEEEETSKEHTVKARPQKQNHNVLDLMKANTKGPLSVLQKYCCDQVRVRVLTRNYKYVRGICTGFIIAYDKHFNIAMVDVDESYQNPVPPPTASKTKKHRKRNKCTDKRKLNASQGKNLAVDDTTHFVEHVSQLDGQADDDASSSDDSDHDGNSIASDHFDEVEGIADYGGTAGSSGKKHSRHLSYSDSKAEEESYDLRKHLDKKRRDTHQKQSSRLSSSQKTLHSSHESSKLDYEIRRSRYHSPQERSHAQHHGEKHQECSSREKVQSRRYPEESHHKSKSRPSTMSSLTRRGPDRNVHESAKLSYSTRGSAGQGNRDCSLSPHRKFSKERNQRSSRHDPPENRGEFHRTNQSQKSSRETHNRRSVDERRTQSEVVMTEMVRENQTKFSACCDSNDPCDKDSQSAGYKHVLRRHVNQLFIRGDNVVLISPVI